MNLTLAELFTLRRGLDQLHLRLSDQLKRAKVAEKLLIKIKLKENQDLYEKISIEIERRKGD